MRCRSWVWSGALTFLALLVPGRVIVDFDLHVRASQDSADQGLADVSVSDLPVPCFDPATVPDFGAIPGFVTNRTELPTAGDEAVAQVLASVRLASCLIDGDLTRCLSEDVVFDVKGHADERASYRPGGNAALSLGRAESAAEVLRNAEATVGMVVGLADTEPSPAPIPDQRTNEERWADDRRVVIVPGC